LMEVDSPPTSKTNPPGVIFDLDGTLADTLGDITDAVNVALQPLVLDPLLSARVQPLVGEGLPVLLTRASGVSDPETLAQLVARFRGHYREHLLDRTRLYDGIPEVLDRLCEAGCPLAVLSNKPHDATQTICAKLLAPWPVCHCLGAEDSRPNKPDAAGALVLAAFLSRPPGQIILVGDSGVDVSTAINAGMRPIGVTWGFRDREELERAGAAAVVDQPQQLPGVILGQSDAGGEG
jgi:phosphoglycolate phosphatase